MDRKTVQYGQVPLETDLLGAQQFVMTGLGKVIEAMVGTGTAVQGFPLAPTSPASMSVVLGAGQVFEQESLEATAWSSLPVDTHQIMKQGLMLDPVQIALLAPTTTGYAQTFLLEVSYSDSDSVGIIRPYYNAASPTVPFQGPNGNGQADSTVRKGVVSYQIKAGAAATAGTQATPAPDAGWVGLYLITLTQGQTTVTAGNITVYQNAPFIPVTLPGVPAGVQGGTWVYGIDTGSADALNVTLTPTPVAIGAGFGIKVLKANTTSATTTPTITINTVNGPVTYPLKKSNGSALAAGDLVAVTILDLVCDGTNFRHVGITKSGVQAAVSGSGSGSGSSSDNAFWHVGVAATGSAPNALVMTLTPVPILVGQGLCMRIPIAAINTAATTIAFADTAGTVHTYNIVLNQLGTPMAGGELLGGYADIQLGTSTNALLLNSAAVRGHITPFGSASSSGTFSFTPKVGWVRAKVIGAGGMGGYANSGSSAGAGGGDTEEGWYQVTPGVAITVTVGAGGNGLQGGTFNGLAGGTSSFGSLATAGGGGGGYGVSGGAAQSTIAAGGTGSGGQIKIPGSTGSGGTSSSGGSGGGTSMAPGAPFGSVGAQGSNGSWPGSGGAGTSGTSLYGGSGANGYVEVEERY